MDGKPVVYYLNGVGNFVLMADGWWKEEREPFGYNGNLLVPSRPATLDEARRLAECCIVMRWRMFSLLHGGQQSA